MITGKALYNVLSEVVPLYVTMILAYASVKWWKIFNQDQCSGINKFVSLFAVPVLSFNFISANNLYEMNFRFIGADTLQKVIILVVLAIWSNFSSKGSLDWYITLFSLSTLPNTLVMGVPLLEGMYGKYSGTLMIQIVVLQAIIWYTLLIFLFEYRGAKLLISQQFPNNGGSIASIEVDSNVVSLDGNEPLETQAELRHDGKLHVSLRKSTSSRSISQAFSRDSHHVISMIPTPSNLTHVEIYSLPNSRIHSLRNSSRGSAGSSLVDCYSFRRAKSLSTVNPMTSSLLGFNEDSNGGGNEVHALEPRAPKDHDDHAKDELRCEDNKPSANVVNEEGPAVIKFGSSLNPENQPKVPTTTSESNPNSMPSTSVITKLILIMVWRRLIRNPNTYACLIGLIWSLISFRWHIQLPKIVFKSIKLLSDTGLGIAMFSLGLFMALQPKMIACGKAKASIAMVVRFLIGPAVMAAASAAIGLRGSILKIAIVQATLPQGIVTFVYAKEYNVHPEILSTAVIFGMLIALPITLVYYMLLEL